MPRIEDFGSFVIYMYYQDHDPPHFHVIGPDFKARIAIEDLRILSRAGKDRPMDRAIKRALEWAGEDDHRARLESAWAEYSGGT
ncbi:MAG: DUF4160 domain-containing protein [Hyphomicrobiales bacterium]|nr:DUF4160 domain-containing protein [Hyphomicrobiales bacterium]MCP5371967.1 DUF4160 domain-containing protein [Hyphomicrobiales bacterium]